MSSARSERILLKDVLKILLASQNQDGQDRVLDIFHSLAKYPRESCRITNAGNLERFLRNHSQLFQVRKHTNGNEAFVTLTTTLTLCPIHSNRSHSCSDKRCSKLHICTFYLLSGKCQYGRKCLFGHDIGTPHNRTVLDLHGMANFDIVELGQLLCLPWVRRGVTVPKVCIFYNQLRGCKSQEACHSFHLCLPHVQAHCKFKALCKRNHDITDQQVSQTLALFGVRTAGRYPEAILEEIRMYAEGGKFSDDHRNSRTSDVDDRGRKSFGSGAMGHRFGSDPNLFKEKEFQKHTRERGPRCQSAGRFLKTKRSTYTAMTSPNCPRAPKEKLCLFHLQDQCRYRDDCYNLHTDSPFLWRIAEMERDKRRKVGDELLWYSMDPENNVQLEEYFSQPDVCHCSLDDFEGTLLKVNFRKFVAESDSKQYKLRRLGTPSSEDSSALGKSGKLLDTVWNWYWKDKETDCWSLFGLEKGQAHLPWGSDRVERNFLHGPQIPLEFDHYSLDFNKMRLTDLDSGLKFKVRRRPKLPVLHDEDSDETDSESQTGDSDENSEGEDCARNYSSDKEDLHDADDDSV